MNKHYYLSDLRDSILSDGGWTWNPVALPDKGIARFQVEEGYSYVLQLIPKTGLLGLIFGSRKQIRVVNSKGRKWMRLYSVFQKIGNKISVVLVKTQRNDSREIKYYYWAKNKNYVVLYKANIEGEVSDPEKFVRFLELHGNHEKLRMTVDEQIYRHIAAKAKNEEDIHQEIKGKDITHSILTEAGYSVRSYNLHFEEIKLCIEAVQRS